MSAPGTYYADHSTSLMEGLDTIRRRRQTGQHEDYTLVSKEYPTLQQIRRTWSSRLQRMSFILNHILRCLCVGLMESNCMILKNKTQ